MASVNHTLLDLLGHSVFLFLPLNDSYMPGFLLFSLYTFILDEFCGRLFAKMVPFISPSLYLCKVTWQLILSRGRIYSYLINLDWPWLTLADRIWQTMLCQLQAWTPLPCEQACTSLLNNESPMAQSLQPTANKAAGEWGHVRPASFSQPESHLLMWSRYNALPIHFFSQPPYAVRVFHFPVLQMRKLRRREVNEMPIKYLRQCWNWKIWDLNLDLSTPKPLIVTLFLFFILAIPNVCHILMSLTSPMMTFLPYIFHPPVLLG